MKKFLIITLLLFGNACGHKEELHPKYKSGDIVCLKLDSSIKVQIIERDVYYNLNLIKYKIRILMPSEQHYNFGGPSNETFIERWVQEFEIQECNS